MSYVNKSEELKSLQHALSLYTQTTDALINNFVSSQSYQGNNAELFNRIRRDSYPGREFKILPELFFTQNARKTVKTAEQSTLTNLRPRNVINQN